MAENDVNACLVEGKPECEIVRKKNFDFDLVERTSRISLKENAEVIRLGVKGQGAGIEVFGLDQGRVIATGVATEPVTEIVVEAGTKGRDPNKLKR